MKPMIAASGGAQLVAGIGDEIDARALGGMAVRAVDKVDQPSARCEGCDFHPHALFASAEPNQIGTAILPRNAEPLGGGGMPDRQPHVLAHDVRAQQGPRGDIRLSHAPIDDQQQRFGDCIDHRTTV